MIYMNINFNVTMFSIVRNKPIYQILDTAFKTKIMHNFPFIYIYRFK